MTPLKFPKSSISYRIISYLKILKYKMTNSNSDLKNDQHSQEGGKQVCIIRKLLQYLENKFTKVIKILKKKMEIFRNEEVIAFRPLSIEMKWSINQILNLCRKVTNRLEEAEEKT